MLATATKPVIKKSKSAQNLAVIVADGVARDEAHRPNRITVYPGEVGTDKKYRFLNGYEGCNNRECNNTPKIKSIAANWGSDSVSKRVYLLKGVDPKTRQEFFYILDGQHRMSVADLTEQPIKLDAIIYDNLDAIPDVLPDMPESKLYRYIYHLCHKSTHPSETWNKRDSFATSVSKSPWVSVFQQIKLVSSTDPLKFSAPGGETLEWTSVMKAHLYAKMMAGAQEILCPSIGDEALVAAFRNADVADVTNMAAFLGWWLPMADEYHRFLGLKRTTKAVLPMCTATAICVGYLAFQENVNVKTPNKNCTSDKLMPKFKEGAVSGLWHNGLLNRNDDGTAKLSNAGFYPNTLAARFLKVANKGLQTKDTDKRKASDLITLCGKSELPITLG